MSDRYHCVIEGARVREDRRDTLDALVRKMFERRHHGYVEGREKEWLTIELVQSLREASRVYREELSSKTGGPLPFALGYFRLREGTLELVSDKIPGNVDPKTLVRLLSEFLEPGAKLWFETEEMVVGWRVRGVDEIRSLSPSENGRDSG